MSQNTICRQTTITSAERITNNVLHNLVCTAMAKFHISCVAYTDDPSQFYRLAICYNGVFVDVKNGIVYESPKYTVDVYPCPSILEFLLTSLMASVEGNARQGIHLPAVDSLYKDANTITKLMKEVPHLVRNALASHHNGTQGGCVVKKLSTQLQQTM